MRKTYVLPLIGGLFLLSGAARLTLEPTPVVAAETAPPPKSCPVVDSSTPAALSDALNRRKDALDQREARLEEQAVVVSKAREEVAAELDRVEQARAELKKLVTLADAGAENDLAQLTAAYEAMKPEDAARLFSEMPAEFAAGFLGRMRPQAAAGILAGLEPETALAMSVYLAGRNAHHESGSN